MQVIGAGRQNKAMEKRLMGSRFSRAQHFSGRAPKPLYDLHIMCRGSRTFYNATDQVGLSNMPLFLQIRAAVGLYSRYTSNIFLCVCIERMWLAIGGKIVVISSTQVHSLQVTKLFCLVCSAAHMECSKFSYLACLSQPSIFRHCGFFFSLLQTKLKCIYDFVLCCAALFFFFFLTT